LGHGFASKAARHFVKRRKNIRRGQAQRKRPEEGILKKLPLAHPQIQEERTNSSPVTEKPGTEPEQRRSKKVKTIETKLVLERGEEQNRKQREPQKDRRNREKQRHDHLLRKQKGKGQPLGGREE